MIYARNYRAREASLETATNGVTAPRTAHVRSVINSLFKTAIAALDAILTLGVGNPRSHWTTVCSSPSSSYDLDGTYSGDKPVH